jgi:hypothetical protein
MKNIHILPTDKPSRLINYLKDNSWDLFSSPMPKVKEVECKNIYITSDEEIKEGNWFISGGLLWKANNNIQLINHKKDKKIILTTNQELIKDGIQPILDDFLEWFVKNPSCEEVELDIETELDAYYRNGIGGARPIKIIIPQEECKQETLEEAAENYVIDESYLPVYKEECKRSFTNGANWQAGRMFDEEDVYEYAIFYKNSLINTPLNIISPREWFKKFKK